VRFEITHKLDFDRLNNAPAAIFCVAEMHLIQPLTERDRLRFIEKFIVQWKEGRAAQGDIRGGLRLPVVVRDDPNAVRLAGNSALRTGRKSGHGSGSKGESLKRAGFLAVFLPRRACIAGVDVVYIYSVSRQQEKYIMTKSINAHLLRHTQTAFPE
jgi:hypothetical protein